MTHKKLYKSEENKVFAGIIGGLGEYFDIDPVILRVIWVLAVIFTGIFPGIFAYIIFLFIVPPKHHTQP
ncbi:MAG: PspC domain-containing protein [Candidatus Niyogibacteria bacterium CG10_big_fil_rev_8_21_14_0_10_46_36]|uniref:PspC domain-containing protein n=1 Tax=Candidatus Niyogibacteria bacterium CG10_big_fil_rev_8_21_14_0_10_46_36 TaxID=1974726 RepID=A0A2H0TCA0_9BACT|nr:MAG: PspC domain-containing protein [Candidatus Niyogibacteria bacterium CG10_big_fil_rev_8_21_14_0_10_46_36]